MSFLSQFAAIERFKKKDAHCEILTPEVLGIPDVEVELMASTAITGEGLNDCIDFVDFIDLPDGRLGISVGRVKAEKETDVIAAEVGRRVRDLAELGIDMSEVVPEARALLGEERFVGRDICVFYGVLDRPARAFAFVKADDFEKAFGEKGRRLQFLKPVRLSPNWPYGERFFVEKVELAPGQKIVIFTDSAHALPTVESEGFSEEESAAMEAAANRNRGLLRLGLRRGPQCMLPKRASSLVCDMRIPITIVATSPIVR